jgi:hypothetical protein
VKSSGRWGGGAASPARLTVHSVAGSRGKKRCALGRALPSPSSGGGEAELRSQGERSTTGLGEGGGAGRVGRDGVRSGP